VELELGEQPRKLRNPALTDGRERGEYSNNSSAQQG